MWRDYFPNAIVHGFDILESSMFNDVRIITHLTDASIEASLRDSLAKGAPYDLLVDDGSHQLAHQMLFRRVAIDFLRPGGYLVIEDVYEQDVEQMSSTLDGCSLVYVHRGSRGYLDNFVCYIRGQ